RHSCHRWDKRDEAAWGYDIGGNSPETEETR
ncbi:unnamed protein product, partial [marine sediment metagenome]